MLGTFRQVEISQLCRYGGEHHSQHPRPGTKSRNILLYRQFQLLGLVPIAFHCNSLSLSDHNSQGICTLLVQGRSIVEGVKGHLACLAATRRSLKSSLFTKWGVYVWKELDYFSVDDHLMDPPCSFRGRPINESNIQVSVQFQFGRVISRYI